MFVGSLHSMYWLASNIESLFYSWESPFAMRRDYMMWNCNPQFHSQIFTSKMMCMVLSLFFYAMYVLIIFIKFNFIAIEPTKISKEGFKYFSVLLKQLEWLENFGNLLKQNSWIKINLKSEKCQHEKINW